MENRKAVTGGIQLGASKGRPESWQMALSVATLAPALQRSPSVSSKSSSTTQAAATQAVDVTREVALKEIPKKRK